MDARLYNQNTNHYQHRMNRIEAIQEIGYGKPLFAYVINKGHKDGAEIHVITSTAIIMIYNHKTRRHITDLIARPGQLKRYGITDQALLDLAEEHKQMGLNNL